jgi:hypothetical protein
MKEEDYLIRSFKPKAGSAMQLEDLQNSMMNSMSYNSMGGMGMSVPTLLNARKSISVLAAQTRHQPKHPKELRVIKKFETTIFKNHRFYIESAQKKEIELHDLAQKISKNGGEVCVSRADIKEGHCFYILKDSSQNSKHFDDLQKCTGDKVQLQKVSHRWINECLARIQFIDLNKDSYIYQPFNFKTPIHNFCKMTFDVLGVDNIHKLRLK